MKLIKIGSATTNNIVIKSQHVSSVHAELILLDNGDMILEDKNSKNGTFLMNKRVQPMVSIPIRRGDAIRFADVELQWSQVPISENNTEYKEIYGIGSNFRNEIQIEGTTVSRFHATLKIGKDKNAYIVDHSKNGTTVNGIKIRSDFPVKIKYNDSVICGGVPVDLRRFIKVNHTIKIFAAAGIALFIVAVVLFGKKIINPLQPSDLSPAVVYVQGEYYITATFNKDPFTSDAFTEKLKQIGAVWPKEYIFSYSMSSSGQKNWKVITDLDNNSANSKLEPITYSGTAFFISRDGKLATNRHIAMPWEYLSDEDMTTITNYMQQVQISLMPVSQISSVSDLSALANSKLGQILLTLVQKGLCTGPEILGYINAFRNSSIKVTGHHSSIEIGYSGRNYNSNSELSACNVIKESGDPKIDVAILQLNDHKTPDEVKHIFNIDDARTDVSSLKPQQEDLFTIGFPGGTIMGLDNKDGGMKSTIHKINVSKEPGVYNFQFQGEEIGGASGSPIFDKKGQLVGVLWGGWKIGNTFGEACEIKYLKKLYDETQTQGSDVSNTVTDAKD